MMQCRHCGARFPDNYLFCGVDGQRLEPVTEADPLLGHVIAGAYRIQRVLGSGGYGVVCLADHERLPMQVAIKVLARRRTQDAVAVARFKREVEAEAVVSHPNVVKVIDYGHDGLAGYFIVMEYLKGHDLGLRLEEGKLPHILDTFQIVEQVGGALIAAHKLGIVHRDVKADNVFLVRDASAKQGFIVKLLDFGVAKLTKPLFEPKAGVKRVELNSTMASTMLGSPCTVSPEILRGQSADQRADVYSFGAMLFEMLTGEILFAARNIESMLERVVSEMPPAPSTVPGAEWVIPELDKLILEMLAKKPDDRPNDIQTVIDRFDKIRTQVEKEWAAHFLTSAKRRSKLIEFEFDGDESAVAVAPAAGAHTDVYVEIKPLNKASNRVVPLVLIVDDDRVIRGLVRQLVSRPGFECETMETANKAQEWMKSNAPPDAIVLDLLMPGMDGLSFLKGLRARGYKGPVIVCSSAVNAILRTEAEALKNVRVIDKASGLHTIPRLLQDFGLKALA
jgi:serine/threonine protein kinase